MYGTVKVGNQSTKKFCELRNNQTSPGLRGMEGLILSSTKVMCGVTSIKEGVPFDSTLKFSVKSILFNLVISLERYQQKHNSQQTFVALEDVFSTSLA